MNGCITLNQINEGLETNNGTYKIANGSLNLVGEETAQIGTTTNNTSICLNDGKD